MNYFDSDMSKTTNTVAYFVSRRRTENTVAKRKTHNDFRLHRRLNIEKQDKSPITRNIVISANPC
jgi:hypothetical protein